jgi:hypothetical protein
MNEFINGLLLLFFLPKGQIRIPELKVDPEPELDPVLELDPELERDPEPEMGPEPPKVPNRDSHH